MAPASERRFGQIGFDPAPPSGEAITALTAASSEVPAGTFARKARVARIEAGVMVS